MTVLAIGPRAASPSWDWVGLGMAGGLARYFDVVLFDGLERPPDADLVLVVKQRPSAAFVACARRRGARVFFAPIDVYRNPADIAADADMLRGCDAVLVHAPALRPVLAPFCRRTCNVEHHARFALDRLADFNADGPLLWIGAIQHVPHVLHWLDRHSPPIDVVLLTDLDSRSGRIAAHLAARRLGVSLRIGGGAINGRRAEQWSEVAQARLMHGCKASIDIKGDSFDQATKPPTKAQQFVASGVPFGGNANHPALGYFRARGFEAADAADFGRLLSRGYWSETRAFAARLRDWTSLDAVVRAYHRILSCAC
jgi:hypothetical protein